MMNHLPLHRLEPDVKLTVEERAHLSSCDRCQLEAELLSEVASSGAPVSGSFTFTFGAPDDSEPVPASEDLLVPALGARYRLGAVLGVGGMGEVVRAEDRVLQRGVAIKCVRPEIEQRSGALQRFIWEARIGAILQHPGVLPVHDLGRLPDGRLAIVMKEVSGFTFRTVLSDPAQNQRSLVSALVRVADTLAYAHRQGVVHRDLKPPNIMLGTYGEVWVLDWGIAQLRGETRDAAGQGLDGLDHTRAGAVAGTPGYMAPEQAAGHTRLVGPPVDVYALGVVLHEVLTGQRPTPAEQARFHLGETAPLPASRTGHPPPEELVDLMVRCMAASPESRPTAHGVSQALTEWLDGSHRRARAQEEVDRVRDLPKKVASLRALASQQHREARDLWKTVEPWTHERDKAPIWELEDHAREILSEAMLLETRYEQSLQGALTHHAELEDAHVALGGHYLSRHGKLERKGERDAAKAFELRISLHASELPADHPKRIALERYLTGDGALTLHTDPPGATVWAARESLVHRRMQAGIERKLGQTPLDGIPLPMGTYRLRIEAPGRAPVIYPVTIRREQHWSGVPPGEQHPQPIPLLPVDELGEGECYVPAGWCTIGGDRETADLLPRRQVWVRGFIIERDPVSVQQYIRFVQAMKARGTPWRHLLPSMLGNTKEEGRTLFVETPDGRFESVREYQAELQPDHPIRYIDWECATAYTRWTADQTGLPWQLPSELWWEKAARGTDGRLHPWGDHHDMSWRHCRLSQPTPHPVPLTPGRFPTDTSPYGVRGLAGGVRDWLCDAFDPRGIPGLDAPDDSGSELHPFRSVRGGGFDLPASRARSTLRNGSRPTTRDTIGFRMARPVGPA